MESILILIAILLLLQVQVIRNKVMEFLKFLNNVKNFLDQFWPKKIQTITMFYNGQPFKKGEFMIIKDDQKLGLISLQFTDSKGNLSPDKISGGEFSISDADLGTLTAIDGVSCSFVPLAKLGKATLQWKGHDDDTNQDLVASGDIEVIGGHVLSVSLNFGEASPQ